LKLFIILSAMFALQANADAVNESATTYSHESIAHDRLFHVNPILGVAQMGLRNTGFNSDIGTGVSAGALAEVGGTIAFQTGVMYNQFGSRTGGDQAIDLDYVSVPLFLKYNALGTAEKSLYLRGGFMPGFLISQDTRYQTYRKDDAGIQSFDLPVVVGFGGAIPVAPRIAVTLGLDWVHSLTNISDKANGETRNDGFMVTTGATLGL
jgi:hypothetical protein